MRIGAGGPDIRAGKQRIAAVRTAGIDPVRPHKRFVTGAVANRKGLFETANRGRFSLTKSERSVLKFR